MTDVSRPGALVYDLWRFRLFCTACGKHQPYAPSCCPFSLSRSAQGSLCSPGSLPLRPFAKGGADVSVAAVVRSFVKLLAV